MGDLVAMTRAAAERQQMQAPVPTNPRTSPE